ncbi:hypothetical protein FRC03_004493 [Tulasnella sp. 419]|nr:hypothetical protein FRC03_004493 [Tulasnella sp. 419]
MIQHRTQADTLRTSNWRLFECVVNSSTGPSKVELRPVAWFYRPYAPLTIAIKRYLTLTTILKFSLRISAVHEPETSSKHQERSTHITRVEIDAAVIWYHPGFNQRPSIRQQSQPLF